MKKYTSNLRLAKADAVRAELVVVADHPGTLCALSVYTAGGEFRGSIEVMATPASVDAAADALRMSESERRALARIARDAERETRINAEMERQAARVEAVFAFAVRV